jgi:TctA family transporter
MSLRWLLLIATEVIFWSGLIAFFTLRYGLKRPDLSRFVILFVVAEHVALLVYGVVDFLRAGTWDTYQSIIAGILGYMLIFGRKDLARLDVWVARRVERWQDARNQVER